MKLCDKLKIILIFSAFSFQLLAFGFKALAQDKDIEFNLDINSEIMRLPKVFQPNIDLSGRGFHRNTDWPQEVAALETLDAWKKDLGFGGTYRLQYNLWQINQLSKDKEAQAKLLDNYEAIIRSVNESGGIVILDLFGTPAGLGRALDKKSPPWDLKAYKELVKSVIRELSCNKKYNIWYEVWNAPDLDDFFLGRKQDYLNIYRAVAEAAMELQNETKIHIPVGGPAVSWWFQAVDGNTIITPERSLIYDLIRYCYHYRLPLDFISWHGYSDSASAEAEVTIYKKTPVNLIRTWLGYFGFEKSTPLIIDEWNYDRDANVLPERAEKSYIAASYIPARLKNMFEAGIDYQIYFCLEDFKNNKEGVVRNVGVFGFDPEKSEYKADTKASYNVFKMLNGLGGSLFKKKIEDEFIGSIATKTQDGLALLVYNYVDPDIAINFLSKKISSLSGSERNVLLRIIKSDKIPKIMQGELDIASVRATKRVKTLLQQAKELSERARMQLSSERSIKLNIKNLKDTFIYQKYKVDSSCSKNCEFSPIEEKEVSVKDGIYQETVILKPYSVQLIVLKKKPEPETEKK